MRGMAVAMMADLFSVAGATWAIAPIADDTPAKEAVPKQSVAETTEKKETLYCKKVSAPRA